ncbi:hypothetical protein [Streptacidiphilus rugosus]|uniref:hypothetical protein n=1 Tax=Streptacidiphilus rugosus TaxID=405783 RepID=UPI00056142B5|nr:hypothetical protein [Streptacidiphilus rugosus]
MTAPSAARAASLDLRLLRALPFATVCVLVSALGHTLGGGGTVPLPTLLIGLVLVLVAATALAGRERGLPAIAAGLAVGELALHALFHLGRSGMDAMSASMPGMSGMSGMGGASAAADPLTQLAAKLICGPAGAGDLYLPPGTTAAQIVSRAGIDPHLYLASLPSSLTVSHGGAWAVLGLSPLMLLGHLLAALVAGWWLRRGEQALFRLLALAFAPLRTLFRLLLALVALPGDASGSAPRRRAQDWRLPGRALLRHQLVRRGPPRALPA